MRSSGRARDSCPSSCSTSPSGLPGDGTKVIGVSGGKNRVQSFLQRRLMWQRKKLFGRADDGVKDNLWPRNFSRLIPVSSESTPKARGGCSDHWWSTDVPQLLPLPVKASLRLTEKGSGSKGERKRNSSITSGKSSKPSTYCRRGFPEEFRLVSQNLRMNIPARSAPGSCLPTPPVSPRKFAHQESFASKSEVPPTFRRLSDSEIPTQTLPRFISHVYPDSAMKSCHYPNHSPLPSPTATRSHPNPSSRKGITCSFYHHKSLSKANISTHPLPLPPGALPCQSSSSLSPGPCQSSNSASPGILKGSGVKENLSDAVFLEVFMSQQTEAGALCAMKEVDVIADDPRSAECVRQLELIEDHFYIYLEYVYPGSINKYVSEHIGTMMEPVVQNFTRHILSGLAYLHSKSIIHRDIEGVNLLVDSMGVVKLVDFGMAKHVLSLKGSPYWLSPEGAVTSKTNPDIACAVDIWSVGCTVIEMVNGNPMIYLWGYICQPRAMFQVLNGRSPPIPEKLSSEGKDFLHLCFCRKPAKRPSASTLLHHPFLRNANDQHFPIIKQPFNLLDKSRSDHAKHKFDVLSVPPGTGISNESLA